MIPFHILGLLYAIFYLQEVRKDETKEDAAFDNTAVATELENRNVSTLEIAEPAVQETKNACLEFFDPRLAKQCFVSLFKKREYGVRPIIILLMLMHFIMNGVTQGESQNVFLYQRFVLGWDIAKNTYHNVFRYLKIFREEIN